MRPDETHSHWAWHVVNKCQIRQGTTTRRAYPCGIRAGIQGWRFWRWFCKFWTVQQRERTTTAEHCHSPPLTRYANYVVMCKSKSDTTIQVTLVMPMAFLYLQEAPPPLDFLKHTTIGHHLLIKLNFYLLTFCSERLKCRGQISIF